MTFLVAGRTVVQARLVRVSSRFEVSNRSRMTSLAQVFNASKKASSRRGFFIGRISTAKFSQRGLALDIGNFQSIPGTYRNHRGAAARCLALGGSFRVSLREANRFQRPAVDRQRQNIGPGVMATDIERSSCAVCDILVDIGI